MNIYEYSPENMKRYKDSNIAITIAHHEMNPYSGRFNYFKNISLPITTRYCQVHNIDLVLITDFKKEIYPPTQPEVFKGRCTMYPFQVFLEMLDLYEYISPIASHSLTHKNMLSLHQIIKNKEDCIVPQKNYNPFYDGESIQYTLDFSAARLKYDKKKVHNFYRHSENKYWWSGPHIIVNKNMKHWFDLELAKDNDMIYRYIQYAENYQKYKSGQLKMFIDNRLNMLSMNLFVLNIMRTLSEQRKQINAYTIFNQFKSPYYYNIIKDIFQSKKCVYSHFGGCGSYGSAWSLRVMMMNHMVKTFKQYYY